MAGTVTLRFEVDSAAARRELRRVQGSLRDVEATGTRSGGRLNRVLGVGLRGAAIAGGAAVAGLGVGLYKSVQAAASFQEQLSVLEAVSGATNTEMNRLRKTALQLGADAKLPATSAQDAAEAMTELAKGGLSVREAMAAARGTLQLAAAAEITAGEAAQISANALNAFGLAGSQATHVADLLAGAANASTGDITDFAEGLQFAGSAMKGAGQTAEDTVTALALLANAGLSGSVAGSSLAGAFRALQAPTGKASDLMKEMGLELYDARGNMLPMRDIITEMQTEFKGLTQEQQNQRLATLFGSRAVQAARILFLGGADAFDKMRDSVDKAGNAQRLAEARTKGFSGAVRALKSAAETLGIIIGSELLPPLASAFTAVADLVAKVAEAKNLRVAVGVIFTGIRDAVSSLFERVRDAIVGGTTTTRRYSVEAHRFITFTKRDPGLADQVRQAIRSAVEGGTTTTRRYSVEAHRFITFTRTDPSLGRQLADSITSGFAFTSAQGATMVESLTAAFAANLDTIADLGAQLAFKIVAKLIDPAFWIEHWREMLVIAMAVFPIGTAGRIGLAVARAIGAPILRLFGTTLSRAFFEFALRLPRAIQVAIVRIIGFFQGGWRQVVRNASATWGVFVSRLPAPIRVAVNAIQAVVRAGWSAAVAGASALWARFTGLFRKRTADAAGDAANSVRRSFLHAIGTVIARLAVFGAAWEGIKQAAEAVRGVIQSIVGWIQTALGYAQQFRDAVNSIHLPSLGSLIPGRQHGGPVMAGRAYVVGERRPELFVPGVAGRILPRVPTAGSATRVEIHNHYHGMPAEEAAVMASQRLGWDLDRWGVHP